MDAYARPVGEGRHQRTESRDQAEIVERLRSQLLGDASDVVETPRRLERLMQLFVQLFGRALYESPNLEHHSGQGLADLVVELLCNALAFCLLPPERVPAAFMALPLEPLEWTEIPA
jgi:hypothetical protein